MCDVDKEVYLCLVKFFLFLAFKYLHVVCHIPSFFLLPGKDQVNNHYKEEESINYIGCSGCPPGREYRDMQSGNIIPPAIGKIGCFYFKCIAARMQIGEVNDVTFSEWNPIPVEVNHPVSVLHWTGSNEVESWEIDIERRFFMIQCNAFDFRYGWTVDNFSSVCSVLYIQGTDMYVHLFVCRTYIRRSEVYKSFHCTKIKGTVFIFESWVIIELPGNEAVCFRVGSDFFGLCVKANQSVCGTDPDMIIIIGENTESNVTRHTVFHRIM